MSLREFSTRASRRPLEAIVALLLLGASSSVQAQNNSSRSYFGLEAGPVFTRSEPGRSDSGIGAGVIAGHEFRPMVSGELRLRLDYFEAPPVFINPGGCLGQIPCSATSDRMRIGSLAMDGVLGDPTNIAGPLGSIGVGIRNVDILPSGGGGLGAFGEVAGGVRIPIAGVVMSADLRCQFVAAATSGPRWTLPIMLGIRF